jgi:Flp pilus assembly pilin Flp
MPSSGTTVVERMKRAEGVACRRRFGALREQQGQTIAEYAVLIAAAAVLLVLAFLFVAMRVGGAVEEAGSSANPSAPFKPPVATCDGNYSGACLPSYPPDLDCGYLEARGIGRVTVVGSDPHGLDPDGNKVACD